MTLTEFKAWFEGFTEDMKGAPDEKQWKRIKARVKDIDGVAVTKTVFVDHYVEPYRRYWGSPSPLNPFLYGGAVGMGIGVSNNVAQLSAISMQAPGGTGGEAFDGYSAMMDLGKAEYSAALNPRSTS